MDNINKQLAEYARMIEEALPGYLPRCPDPESLVAEAMRYSLLGGGKRIRGALLLAFYRLFSEDVRPALPYAAAVEMMHASSLIHDDLPCMDDDDMRRGKPSCHIAHGEATALLAGDALIILAFETMSDARYAGAFPCGRALEAVRCLAASTGCNGMIGGQIIDLNQEGKPTPAPLLERMYARKTGALIAVSARIGCILGGAGDAAIEAAVSYSAKIGLAFQIIDDILDITGDQSKLGKPIGSDRENGKTTYASIHGVEASRRQVEQLNAQAKMDLAAMEKDTSFLAGLADLLAGRQY